MCDQQRLRPACAYAQTDQSLCLSLEYSMTVELLTEHCLEFLSLTGGCTGLSESTLVKMSNCWKSRAVAHFIRNVSLLRNHHECESRTEKIIRRITVLQQGACQVMTNGDPEGRIFLSILMSKNTVYHP